MTPRIALLASITMVAFAMNSVFARFALTLDAIDPAGYTSIRLGSGALMLFMLMSLRKASKNATPIRAPFGHTAIPAGALFIYAAFFSFAYLSLDSGIGALILFACVQITMIGYGLYKGERPSLFAWIGIVLALGGFVYLVSPGLTAPDPFGALLMAISGVAWGIYTLKGKGALDPLGATARNFICSVPLALILFVVFISESQISFEGALIATASGAITSAFGYALWYETLKGLTATRAAIIQLTAPVIATFIGALLLDEDLTLRIVLASLAILGGVALAILAKDRA